MQLALGIAMIKNSSRVLLQKRQLVLADHPDGFAVNYKRISILGHRCVLELEQFDKQIGRAHV